MGSELTKKEKTALIAEAMQRFGFLGFFESLEDLLVHPLGFGLDTATPLQRAICRVAQGVPLGDLGEDKAVKEAIGDTSDITRPPSEVVLLAGIRTGKSLISAAAAIWASQTCEVRSLGPGEIPRVSVVSITKDLSQVVFRHIVGNMESSPVLKRLLLEPPTSDAILVKHPTGRAVEIRTVAGARAGSSLVARWSAGLIADEAPRMVGSEDGVVNLDDMVNSVVGRLLPGAQIYEIGSPWAPFGPVFEKTSTHWKNPTDRLVVIRAPAPALNPVWWTEERVERLKKTDPEAYQTDVLAEFSDQDETLFPSATIEEATRKSPRFLPYVPGAEYYCAMDPATRGDGWTVVIVTREHEKKRVVGCYQWQGNKVNPLKPRAVLTEIRDILAEYQLTWAYTDQYAADALKEIAAGVGLNLVISEWNAKNKQACFSNLAAQMSEGVIELPDDALLHRDLKLTRRRVTQSGYTIVLPRTPDGRHCDYAPALARAMAVWMHDVDPPAPRRGEAGYMRWLEQKIIDEEEQELENKQNPDLWECPV